MLKKYEWVLLLKLLILTLAIFAASYLFIRDWYVCSALAILPICYLIVGLYKSQVKIYEEINQFVESIHYRDFSRQFNSNHTSPAIRSLRKGFNEVNAIFKTVSKEKETQYQYLQKILELVDTGIISYESESGNVVWMNESLKKMLNVPYLKTIHSYCRRDENLYNQIMALKPGDNKIGTIHNLNLSYKVLLSATAFQTDGKKFNLIAFQNIDEALEVTESKAWQELLSVLTHEIMNSIAPISSLANTVKNRLQIINNADNSENLDDIKLGIDTIKSRSEGLLKFAETYRNLNKITKPDLSTFYLRDLFENLYNLMEPTLSQKHIELDIILKSPNIALKADINLVEQVLINLLTNAIDAVKNEKKPTISLSADSSNLDKVIIRVTDNGSGMSNEVLEKVFIPFFSTKKTGSGIGLTLCKQIMMLHQGNIQIQTKENEGTSFILTF